MTADSPTPDAIAIVGLACRFPGADSPAAFWRNLRDGVESLRFFSDDELQQAGIPDDLLGDPRYVKSAGGTLRDIDRFDAAFFGLDDAEAELLDPQHRFFLECAHEALETAGIAPDSFDGAIGVFGGVGGPHYLLHNIARNRQVWQRAGRLAVSVSNEKDFLPLRTSYLLDLRGPSIGVQTACSTSLVAVHLACQSLLGGECDAALAGGASISALRPEGYLHDAEGVYSADGHCRAFDASASGMVGGDGVGVVVLRRLEDALASGDTIRAVIRGTAVNNDGSGKVGFIAPGVGSQRQVIREALDVADVDARTVSYVEAHGTGTPLGDMIEVAALTDAFRDDTDDCGFCGLGSVKTNIGHLNTAAGAAALIKTVLALEHRELPPSLHFERPNPEIDFAASPFEVVTRARAWPAGDTPRRAGVHAMAIGGTNAHVVLEEAPAVAAADDPAGDGNTHDGDTHDGNTHDGNTDDGEHLLLVSARTASALHTAVADLATYLETHDRPRLADVAFTLQTGRRAWAHRRALVVGTPGRGADSDRTPDALRTDDSAQTAIAERGDRQIAFVFDGGSRSTDPLPQLARALYESQPALRSTVDRCAEALQPQLGFDLRLALLHGPTSGGDVPAARRPDARTALAFTAGVALGRLWQSVGVQPDAVAGSGAGELVSACIAGVLPLQTALKIIGGSAAGTRPVETPQIPIASSHLGGWLPPATARDLAHWRAVWTAAPAGGSADALHCLRDRPRILLEIGAATPSPQHRRDLLQQLANLWLAGATIDWRRLHGDRRRRRIPLPTYPFERRRFWIEPTDDGGRPLIEEQLAAPTATAPESVGDAVFAAPESELEQSIARVWCDVLGIGRVGSHDNFFAVGGRSLTGIRVMTRLREELQVELALRQLFEAPTVAELAKLVELARWVEGPDDSDADQGDREEIEL